MESKYSEFDLLSTEKLIKDIINCAYLVRKALYCGYLESVYQNALQIELEEHGILVDSQVPITVLYKEKVVGEFRADMIVENRVIIELKAVNALNSSHEIQLVNYLTATNIDNGLLINFGAEKLEIKRKYRKYKEHLD